MIQDTRRAPRRQPTDLVPVTDMLSEAQIGRLGNVSETGMLLLASVPLHDDALYQLRFALPERAGRAPKGEPVRVSERGAWIRIDARYGTAYRRTDALTLEPLR